jgi:hypothetical protein
MGSLGPRRQFRLAPLGARRARSEKNGLHVAAAGRSREALGIGSRGGLQFAAVPTLRSATGPLTLGPRGEFGPVRGQAHMH